MANVNEIPRKDHFKTSEVCQLTDTQPYVLRFWESEFPQLRPDRGGGGQPVYRRADVDLVLRIKRLLYDEEYTIEGARRRLEEERHAPPPPTAEAPPGAGTHGMAAGAGSPAPADAAVGSAGPAGETDVVSRQRYEDAVEEISLLQAKLREAQVELRKAEARVRRAEEVADRQRERAHRALARLEKLLDDLG